MFLLVKLVWNCSSILSQGFLLFGIIVLLSLESLILAHFSHSNRFLCAGSCILMSLTIEIVMKNVPENSSMTKPGNQAKKGQVKNGFQWFFVLFLYNWAKFYVSSTFTSLLIKSNICVFVFNFFLTPSVPIVNVFGVMCYGVFTKRNVSWPVNFTV